MKLYSFSRQTMYIQIIFNKIMNAYFLRIDVLGTFKYFYVLLILDLLHLDNEVQHYIRYQIGISNPYVYS